MLESCANTNNSSGQTTSVEEIHRRRFGISLKKALSRESGSVGYLLTLQMFPVPLSPFTTFLAATTPGARKRQSFLVNTTVTLQPFKYAV